MSETVKIGIIICDRYRDCAGGKCFRALRNREGAFSIYQGQQVELVGYTSCGGCPGGNVEYAPEGMKNSGADVIHFATGLVVGYPPCPYVQYFKSFVEEKYAIDVVFGTHPIPQNYFEMHEKLKTWHTPEWKNIIKATVADENIRHAYD